MPAESTLPPPPSSSLAPPPRPNGAAGGGRRWLRVLHIVVLGAAIPAGIVYGIGGAGGILALFVLIVPLEKLFRRHDQKIRRPGLRTDLTYALSAPVLNVATVVIGAVIALLAFPLWVPALLLRPLVTSQPGWLMAVEAFVLIDVLIYWTHRAYHEIGFLWRFHSIHHSSARLDWISGIRNHPFDGALIIVPGAILFAAGFQLEVVGFLAVVQAILGIFAHANVRWRLRPLHRIVMTPEFHHWHHANYPESIHTNYSVFLPVWDMIWGTYFMPSDRRPEVYGLDDPLPPSMPGQLAAPFRTDLRERYPFPRSSWKRELRRLNPFRRRVPSAS